MISLLRTSAASVWKPWLPSVISGALSPASARHRVHEAVEVLEHQVHRDVRVLLVELRRQVLQDRLEARVLVVVGPRGEGDLPELLEARGLDRAGGVAACRAAARRRTGRPATPGDDGDGDG